MVSLTFQGATFPHLREQIAAFLNGTLPQLTDSGQGQVVHTEAADKIVEPSSPAPKKSRRKAKDPDKESFEQPVKEGSSYNTKSTAETPATEDLKDAQVIAAPVVNKEAVHQALQQVNVVVGLPKAREILQSFSVNRISEIKDDQFKAFIEKCNEAIMAEG